MKKKKKKKKILRIIKLISRLADEDRKRPVILKSMTEEMNSVEETISEHARGSRGVQVGALGCEQRYRQRWIEVSRLQVT